MKLNEKKDRVFPKKPEWQIILDHLVYQDQDVLYRICRRMIIHLDRMKIPEIRELMLQLNPAIHSTQVQNYGPNWPKPKGSPFNPHDIIDKLFEIADNYLSDVEITTLINDWIHQEHIGFLSLVLEKRSSALVEVKEAIGKYLKISYSRGLQAIEERIGLRAALIYRFLSENLRYVNIAKHHIKISVMGKVLDRVIGPAQGTGKVGGKSAGLILAKHVLRSKRKDNPVLEKVKTPKSRFMTSDELYEFLHFNALEEFVYTKYQEPEQIQQEHEFLEYIFKNSHFPHESKHAFSMILDDMEGKPIIVRSSSLLEDSFEGAFSGKYKSLFLSNKGTKEERLTSFMNAIAEVYASVFAPDPIEYRRERGLLDFREEMGILIQQVVGKRIGKYYLPSYAGVAFSYNELRWSQRLRREDGVVRIVAGLGTRAVDRTIDDYPSLISPGQPGLKINQTTDERIRYSQKFVDVINMDTNSFETIDFRDLIYESGGYFTGLEQIVSINKEGELVDPVSAFADFKNADLVLTFNNLFERSPFLSQLKEILKTLEEAYDGPVDVEFASDGENLYLLQCRPQSEFLREATVQVPPNIPNESKIFTASHNVTNGLVKDIEYVVYVTDEGYSNLDSTEKMLEIGRIISRLNRKLPKKKFILLGPGRWGSKGDIKLGVPVIYSDINNTAMLIEVARDKGGYVPELSFGTHFFQDLVETNIKYLPLYPDKSGNIFNEEFFSKTPNSIGQILEDTKEFEHVIRVINVSHFKWQARLKIYMDGELNYACAVVE